MLKLLAGIYAFVVLKDKVSKSEEELIKELKLACKTRVSAFAQPDIVLVS